MWTTQSTPLILNNLTATDVNDSARTATASGDLRVTTNTAGQASVNLGAVFSAKAGAERFVLYSIAGDDNTLVASSAAFTTATKQASLDYTGKAAGFAYTVTAGVDENADGTLAAGEVTKTVRIAKASTLTATNTTISVAGGRTAGSTVFNSDRIAETIKETVTLPPATVPLDVVVASTGIKILTQDPGLPLAHGI